MVGRCAAARGQQLAAIAGPQCAQRGLSLRLKSRPLCVGGGLHLRVVLLAALGCIIEAKD